MKKLVFLIVALATTDGIEDFAQMKKMLALWKAKKLELPKKPIQYEILKIALLITNRIEKGQLVSLA